VPSPDAARPIGKRADGAGVAVQAGAQVAVEHQAAADEGVDEHVEKALHAAPAAGHQLGHAGGGGVLDQVDRQVGAGGHLGAQVHQRPARSATSGGMSSSVCQPPRLNGAAMPTPCTRPSASALSCAAHLAQPRADLGQQLVGVGVAVVQRPALAHRAGEVDQQHVHAAPAHLDADGQRAVGVQPQRHRRLARPCRAAACRAAAGRRSPAAW
jgi:hypothetical protein